MREISRRKALGLMAAISIPPPAVVAASSIEGTSTANGLDTLIAKYHGIVALLDVQTDFISGKDGDPYCPPPACVSTAEIGAHHRELGSPNRFMYPFQIDEHIDRKIGVARRHVEAGISVAYHHDSIKTFEADRITAHVLWQKREDAYRAWEESSGVAAAEREEDRLCEILNDLHTKIISWPCDNMHEVRILAGYALSEGFSPEIAVDVLRSLGEART